MGANYVQISVIFNLWIQGAILTLSGLMPFCAQLVAMIEHPSWIGMLLLIVMGAYAVLYCLGYYSLLKHYGKNYYNAYNLCVQDLQYIAKRWRMSYWSVNILIFIIFWIILIAINVFLTIFILP